MKCCAVSEALNKCSLNSRYDYLGPPLSWDVREVGSGSHPSLIPQQSAQLPGTRQELHKCVSTAGEALARLHQEGVRSQKPPAGRGENPGVGKEETEQRGKGRDGEITK